MSGQARSAASRDPSRLGPTAQLLGARVEEHYGRGDRVERLRVELDGAVVEAGGPERPVEPDTLSALESAGRRVFRHLELNPAQDLEPEVTSPGWPPVDVAEERRQGGGVREVRRAADGTAVIRLDGLAPVQACAPLLAGVAATVAGSERLILDLRENGGGDPATVALIVDWLAGGGPRHLFDVQYRDRLHQWWTAGAAIAAPPTGPVVALIGPRTFSSAECLAWTLQREHLAVLVGAPTGGGADHVVPLALTHDVAALLPEAHVLPPGGGPNWEGVGVQPDRALDLDPSPTSIEELARLVG